MSKDLILEGRVKLTIVEPEEEGPFAVLAANCGGIIITSTGAKQIMYTLPADRQVDLSITYVDAKGNPASIDGAVTWQSSNPAVADVAPVANPPADNSKVTLKPGTTIGSCQVSATADADLGAGTRALVTLLDVTVVGGEAVAGVITPGESVPIP